jgi:putative alpha-1,2-mannosidase
MTMGRQWRWGASYDAAGLVAELKNQPLVIVAENYETNHPYVRQVWLNDVPRDRAWIRHAEIESGGVLKFAMSPEPLRHR